VEDKLNFYDKDEFGEDRNKAETNTFIKHFGLD
jgi:hypothetical protein